MQGTAHAVDGVVGWTVPHVFLAGLLQPVGGGAYLLHESQGFKWMLSAPASRWPWP